MTHCVAEVNTTVEWILHPALFEGDTIDTAVLSSDQQFLVALGHRGIRTLSKTADEYAKLEELTGMMRQSLIERRTIDAAVNTLEQTWRRVRHGVSKQQELPKGLPALNVGMIPLRRQAQNMVYYPEIATVTMDVHAAAAVLVNSLGDACDDLVYTIFDSWKTMIYESMIRKQFPVVTELSNPKSALRASVNAAMAISLVVATVRAERDLPYNPEVPHEWQMANMLPTIGQQYTDIFLHLNNKIMAGYMEHTGYGDGIWNAYST